MKIDLNVDIGEGFPFDDELLMYATSANICCGAHAGNWNLTRETIGKALDANIRIGIHPGYPDRDSMGRRSVSSSEFRNVAGSIESQVERFFNFVPAAYLKPHGAFYNDSQNIEHPAFNLVQSLCSTYQLPLMGFPNTAHSSASAQFIIEGFADRRLNADGSLMSRGKPGAVLLDSNEIARQALQLAPNVDSICLHGDTKGCVEHIQAALKTLIEAGYEVAY